jgi:hypothetical protein
MLFFMPLVRNGKKILGASVGILIFVFTVRPSKTGDRQTMKPRLVCTSVFSKVNG